MRILIAAVSLALLAGCSTPNDLRKNDPTVSALSKKTPKQYALCVFPKWQEARSIATMSETESGYRLIVATEMMTDEVLEITEAGHGSKVVHYQRMPWAKMLGRAALEEAVRDCL
ncbi:hypothetical protein [Pseudomonas sp. PDM04]|uniref:hypothetical protein n=1 Tax=Pseudomonas sp. PDM04 TaxID=2769296 RepID=UPI001780F7BE|nr:hypothetical protein [Pseudomonas sp. PDM04]MBD9443114.1 hypothetical protein [Pseudomonas sp. PDM04]